MGVSGAGSRGGRARLLGLTTGIGGGSMIGGAGGSNAPAIT